MPREIKYCAAPAPFSDHEKCNKPFIATVPSKKFCSKTCENRAHRHNRKHNSFKAGVKSPAADILQQVEQLKQVDKLVEQIPDSDVYDLYFKQSADPKPEDL